jgi:hypothetical protein
MITLSYITLSVSHSSYILAKKPISILFSGCAACRSQKELSVPGGLDHEEHLQGMCHQFKGFRSI